MKKTRKLPQIKLSDRQKEKMQEEIKAFYLDVRGEEIGMIEQMHLMELFEEKGLDFDCSHPMCGRPCRACTYLCRRSRCQQSDR